jgi:hypothetical protein
LDALGCPTQVNKWRCEKCEFSEKSEKCEFSEKCEKCEFSEKSEKCELNVMYVRSTEYRCLEITENGVQCGISDPREFYAGRGRTVCRKCYLLKAKVKRVFQPSDTRSEASGPKDHSVFEVLESYRNRIERSESHILDIRDELQSCKDENMMLRSFISDMMKRVEMLEMMKIERTSEETETSVFTKVSVSSEPPAFMFISETSIEHLVSVPPVRSVSPVGSIPSIPKFKFKIRDHRKILGES